MAMMDTLKTLLYQTIHRNKKPAAQIADEIALSYSYLCRTGLPTDESGVKFPLEYLVPLMKATHDYSVLKHLATLTGHLVVKLPRAFADKSDENEAVSAYNELCAAASKHLTAFFRKPTPENLRLTQDAIQRVLEYSVALSHRVSSYNQMELPL
jgi:hypothetical protein